LQGGVKKRGRQVLDALDVLKLTRVSGNETP